MTTREHISLEGVSVCLNVLVFVVVQTAFFWFVASRELVTVAKKNAQLISRMRAQLRRQPGQDFPVAVLDATMQDATSAVDERELARLESEAEAGNRQLVLRMIAPFAGAMVVVILVLCVVNRLRGLRLGRAQYMGVAFVFGAYTTELLLFFFVVKPWAHVGPFAMMDAMLGCGCGGITPRPAAAAGGGGASGSTTAPAAGA
jgi:hypothetical protein